MKYWGIAALLLAGISMPLEAQQRGITIEYKERAAVGAAPAGRETLYPKSYALVIGNDRYTGGWSRLSNGVKDARAIARTLEKQGFDVTLLENLTSKALESGVEEFFARHGQDDQARLFLWYAGHGHTDSKGEGYLVPTDAPLPSTNEFRFRLSALSLRRFGELVRLVDSRHVYAVFDSCFAGTVFNTARAAPPAAITRAASRPVRQFLTSGDADQTVSDDGAFRELFIDAVEGRRGADANGDGYLTASELGLFLGDQVTNLTEGTQTPRWGKLRDKRFNEGDFIFAQLNTNAANPANPSAASPKPASGGAGLALDQALWGGIRDSSDAGDFDDYLARAKRGEIPGIFAANARRRLTALTGNAGSAVAPPGRTPQPATPPITATPTTAAGTTLFNPSTYPSHGPFAGPKPSQFPAALQPLAERAFQGDRKAMEELGDRYHRGRGVTTNQTKARRWYTEIMGPQRPHIYRKYAMALHREWDRDNGRRDGGWRSPVGVLEQHYKDGSGEAGWQLATLTYTAHLRPWYDNDRANAIMKELADSGNVSARTSLASSLHSSFYKYRKQPATHPRYRMAYDWMLTIMAEGGETNSFSFASRTAVFLARDLATIGYDDIGDLRRMLNDYETVKQSADSAAGLATLYHQGLKNSAGRLIIQPDKAKERRWLNQVASRYKREKKTRGVPSWVAGRLRDLDGR